MHFGARPAPVGLGMYDVAQRFRAGGYARKPGALFSPGATALDVGSCGFILVSAWGLERSAVPGDADEACELGPGFRALFGVEDVAVDPVEEFSCRLTVHGLGDFWPTAAHEVYGPAGGDERLRDVGCGQEIVPGWPSSSSPPVSSQLAQKAASSVPR